MTADEYRAAFRATLAELEGAHTALTVKMSDATVMAYEMACLRCRRAYDVMRQAAFIRRVVR